MDKKATQTINKPSLFYLGPPFSFSHEAGEKYFGNIFTLTPQSSFTEIIDTVLSNKQHTALLPFFNRYESHIRETQEKLSDSDIIAKKVVKHPIKLFLLANPGVGIKDIKYLVSNEHVFKQCEAYLNATFPTAKSEFISSTSGAAEAIKGRSDAAAICSFAASKEYGLSILAEKIQNDNNYTLFFLVEKNGKGRIKIKGLYSLLCIRSDTGLAKKKFVFDLARKHGLDVEQMWTFLHPTEKYHLFYCEILGRTFDLDFIPFEAELKKYFERVKLVGSYDIGITETLRK